VFAESAVDAIIPVS